MSEHGFRIFHYFLIAGASLLYSISLAFFMKPFLAKKREHLRKNLLLVFFLHLAGWLLCSVTAVPKGTFIPVLTVLLLLVSRTLYLEKSFAFLLALLYGCARILSGLITESLQFAAEGLFTPKTQIPDVLYLYSACQTALFFLCHISLLAVMLCLFRQRLLKMPLFLHWQELCYLSLIPAAGILFGQMISGLLLEIHDGRPLSLYDRHPAFLGVVPLLALLFYTGSFLTIDFWQSTETLRREREEYFTSLQQTRAIQKRIQETDAFYARLRRMKHEMRGHLNNIKGLSQSGQYEELEKYIARMDQGLDKNSDSPGLTLCTGNAVTDIIINDIQRQCLEKNIDFHADFHYPLSGQYDAFDLGIILQNLLINAMEACEKITCDGTVCEKKYISLTSRQKRKFFLIEVRNPFSGAIRFKADGLPETTKPDPYALHGIGLSNVRREAEKYMGELELKTEHQEFCATILLQERSNL